MIFLDIFTPQTVEITIETIHHFSPGHERIQMVYGNMFSGVDERKGVRPFNILARRSIIHARGGKNVLRRLMIIVQ